MRSFRLRQMLVTGCQAGFPLVFCLVGMPAIALSPSTPIQAPAAARFPAGDGYVLGAGDRIKVDFFGVPEFTGEYQILPNGTVNFPLVGAIPIQGNTLTRASRIITARFQPYLARPVITVSLVSPRPINVTIAGEINRPGTYTLSALPAASGAEVALPTLTRTLQLAEGVTQAADLRNVQIRRQRADAPGSMEVVNVNLWQLLQSADGRQDVALRDGDSIFIPATTEVDLEQARQLTAATFATRSNRPLRIAVVGEVNRPGPYTIALTSGTGATGTAINSFPSVTQAIQVAGGITQSADIRNIQVKRLTRQGGEQLVKIDFWKLLKSGDVRQDLPLQDGDTVEIPTATAIDEGELTALGSSSFSPDKITINVVGQVERPGPVTVPPNTPLNQAILAAGGFNQKAKKGAVTLIRLNPNGTVTKRDISIDLAQGINEKNNPSLRNNDIVVVKKSFLSNVTDTVNTFLGPFTGIFSIFRLFGL
jgi:polysaccharide export outer membrane protein